MSDAASSRRVPHPWVRALADSSYALYILHFPLISLLCKIAIAIGLQGLVGLSKQFGDLLSYLRLFALGLASASLAATFNGLAADLQAAIPGLGLLLALIILLFGHGITFLLGIMSGVVHGLRLNYIEFFGWGLTEEGYPFRSFAKREVSA